MNGENELNGDGEIGFEGCVLLFFSEGVVRVGGGWSDDLERVEEEGG